MPRQSHRRDDDRLVWIDLEMTGLDIERHVIVEIACIVTDSELELLDDGIDIVVHQDADALARDGRLRAQDAHEVGPAPADRGVDRRPRRRAARRCSSTSSSTCPSPVTAPLCGNSIGVDRRFLDRYLPELDQYLHYRSIDVSSFKELCRRWYPAIYTKRPGKKETHRALDDIRESIEELRYYRETMLISRRDQPRRRRSRGSRLERAA